MRAKGPICNAKELVKWASEKVANFLYRKEFGLSYEDFMNEPLPEFIINSHIMGIRADVERTQNKAMARKSKVR